MNNQLHGIPEQGIMPTTMVAIPQEGTFLRLQHPDDPTREAVLFVRPSEHEQHPLGCTILFFADLPLLPLNEDDARSKAIIDILRRRVYMYDGDEEDQKGTVGTIAPPPMQTSAAFSLEATFTHLYALPIGPWDLTKAPPPDFGHAILVDAADLSSQDREGYEQAGLLPAAGYHLRFSDITADSVREVFRLHLDEIGAWRNPNGTWDAYTTWLPEKR